MGRALCDVDKVCLMVLGLPAEGLHPGDHSPGFSFREVSNSSLLAWHLLENQTRSISRAAFSLAGVPASRAHFKDVKSRQTASGIYLWLLVCTFGG